MQKSFYMDYFKKTVVVWIVFVICIYSIFACEFDELKIPFSLIHRDIEKINNIIKNISYSYIAGVIFFLLSDTIPYLRRKKVACKNVDKSLKFIVNAIDKFSLSINNKIWTNETSAIMIFEDYSGGEYSDNMPPVLLPKHILSVMNTFAESININLDYILSQELYNTIELQKEMELIKLCESIQYISSISLDGNNGTFVEPSKIVKIFSDVIIIRKTVSKYI